MENVNPVRWARPAADLYSNEEQLRLVVDLPGVAPDQVKLRLEHRTLTVEGQVDASSGWRRPFHLPASVDLDKIQARAEHGVLQVQLPLAQAARPREILVMS